MIPRHRGVDKMYPVMRVYRVRVWFGFVRISLVLLLAVVLCWVERCFNSWVLLSVLCLLRVTHKYTGMRPHAPSLILEFKLRVR